MPIIFEYGRKAYIKGPVLENASKLYIQFAASSFGPIHFLSVSVSWSYFEKELAATLYSVCVFYGF